MKFLSLLFLIMTDSKTRSQRVNAVSIIQMKFIACLLS